MPLGKKWQKALVKRGIFFLCYSISVIQNKKEQGLHYIISSNNVTFYIMENS